MRFARLGLALGAFALIAAAPAPDPHIARVEQALPPAVVLEGAPVRTETLAAQMQRLAVPGVSIVVIDRGRIAWAKGYGVEGAGGAVVTPGTRFQAGSISKSVTAIGVPATRRTANRPISSENSKLMPYVYPAIA